MITEIYRLLLKNIDYKNTKKNRTSIKTGGSINSSFLNGIMRKLKSKIMIVLLSLVALIFMLMPIIPIILAYLAGIWLRFTSEKFK